MGATLIALALTMSLASAQLLIYIFSSYSLPLFVLLIIPMWILYGFIMRKAYMMRRVRRMLKKQA